MKPIIHDLETRCAGHLPPIFLLAARLRAIDLAKTSIQEAELKVKAVSLPHLFRQDAHFALSGWNKLSFICSLSRLLVEVEWITTSYAPKGWHNMQMSEDGVFPGPWVKDQVETTLNLSKLEQRKFLEASLHFECHCRIFFLGQETLFKRNSGFRDLFFQAADKSSITTNDFYSITFYVFDQHWSMLKNVMAKFDYEADSLKAPGAERMGSSGSLSEPTIERWQMYEDRFRRRTRLEMHKFIHYLLSQGSSMLLELQSMDLCEQIRFTVQTFYQVATSHHPAILMVRGIDNLRKGTVEADPWQPWEHIECQSYRSLEIWQRGVSFWDEDRFKRLVEERDRLERLNLVLWRAHYGYARPS
ncbi:hypothetical protein FSARC_11410 [Fusarium sarcochroum]|uniref:Uncharacterized protein n=1 Tax=Fusarium sarcochroum TaxID=1208366 RepID=A0A8H4X106_9HYPO|nr:hypothetical protein FSARC_11410 [Fusarium sarcochroum]